MKTLKKLFLLSMLILFTILSACNDSDSNNEEQTEETPEVPEINEYAKYTTYNLSFYDLKEDIKEIEKVYHSAAWDKETNSAVRNSPVEKEKYYFDENGVLTKFESFFRKTEGMVNNEIQYKFYLEGEENYKYDEKYRLTEYTTISYDLYPNYDNPTIKSRTILKYTHDETAKKATRISFYMNNGIEENGEKTIYSLNSEGRIDGIYVELYTIKNKKSHTKSEDLRSIFEYKLIKYNDSKENPVLSYKYFKSDNFEQDQTYSNVTISEYYEQTIAYYDNTTSDKNSTVTRKESLVKDLSNVYTVRKLSDEGWNGNVKKNTFYVYKDILPYSSPSSITSDDLVLKEIKYWDNNGINYETENYQREIYYENNDHLNPKYGILRIYSKYKYEYDSKFRVTTSYKELYTYSSPSDNIPLNITKIKTTITYDEANKKATVINYSGDNFTKLLDKTIHTLDENDMINTNYREYYRQKSNNILKSSLEENLYQTSTKMVNKDNRENIIESYHLIKQYDQAGNLIKEIISNYGKQEIEYY